MLTHKIRKRMWVRVESIVIPCQIKSHLEVRLLIVGAENVPEERFGEDFVSGGAI